MSADTNIPAIIEAARAPLDVKTLADGRQIAIVPQNFKVEVVSRHLPMVPIPERVSGELKFHDGDSLAAYVNVHKLDSTMLVADIDQSMIVARINYHGKDAPAADDHTASWETEYSEEFQRWNAISGRMMSQEEMLIFLEENASDIWNPEPARILELVKDFSSEKTVQFQSALRRDNGNRTLVYVEANNTKGQIEIPQKLTIQVPIYHGEEAVKIDLWFRHRINSGALALGVEFHRIVPVKQAAFRLAVSRVAEKINLVALYGEV